VTTEIQARDVAAGADLLPLIAHLETAGHDDPDNAVSHAGALGRYQIMPGTARHYGFDPARLSDPKYSEQAAGTILNDLWRRYRGDASAVLVAYNAGPGRADKWLATGKRGGLPSETQGYLSKASKWTEGGGIQIAAAAPVSDASPEPIMRKPPRAALPPGRVELDEMGAAGFTTQELSDYKQRETAAMVQGGFTPQEIDKYWGDQLPDTRHMDALTEANLASQTPQAAAKYVTDPLEALAAGWNMSVTGLAINGQVPDTFLAKEASTAAKIANITAQMAGDVPAMLTGFSLGAAGGGALGTAVGGPIGGVVGTVVGAGAGTAAVPQAIREGLILAYRSGEINSWSDFMGIAGSATQRTLKAGAVGAIAAPLGMLGGKVVGAGVSKLAGAETIEIAAAGSNQFTPYVNSSLTASMLGRTADLSTQTAVQAYVGAGLDGRLPDGDDWLAAAVGAFGYHMVATTYGRMVPSRAGERVTDNMEDIFTETGVPPWEAASRAQSDPVLRQELMQIDAFGDPVIPKFRATAMNEPPPYAPPEVLKITGPTEKNGGVVKPEVEGIAQVQGDWVLRQQFTNVPVTRMLSDGTIIPAPDAVAGYLKKFSELAGFKFQVGPAQKDVTDTGYQPAFVRLKQGRGTVGSFVQIPETADALNRRWYGLGTSEVIYHEVGHGLDLHVLHAGREYASMKDMPPALADELIAASQSFAPQLWKMNPGYRMKPSEFMADAIAAWLSNPPIRKQMPLFTAKYGKKLEPYLEIVEATLPKRTGPDTWELPPNDMNPGAAAGAGGGAGQPPAPPSNGQGVGAEPPQRPRIDLDPTMKLDEATLNEIASEFIGAPPEPKGYTFDQFYNGWVSEMGTARKLDDILRTQNYDLKTQMGFEDMFRQTYASDARLAHFIYKGPVELAINAKGQVEFGLVKGVMPVKEIAAMVQKNKGTIAEWENYMVAQRANILEARGLESGHTLSRAQRDDLIKFGADKYEKATQELQKVWDAGLEYGVQTGVFSRAQVERMKQDNGIYISYRRILEERGSRLPANKGRGFKTREPVKKFEGGEDKIMPPLQATLDNLQQIIRAGDRNMAIGSAIGFIERGGLMQELGLKQLKYDPYETIAEPGSEDFKPYGADPEAYKSMLAIRASRFGFSPEKFLYIRNGVPEMWVAQNPDFALLMRGADSPGQGNLFADVMASFARVQRSGIVGMLDFPLRSTIRDQFSAFVNSPHSPPPFVTFFSGMLDAFGKGDRYWEWVRNGGAGAALAEMDKTYFSKDLVALFEETGVTRRIINGVTSPIEMSGLLGTLLDHSNRMGVYKAAKREGLPGPKAAMRARVTHLDFAERGTVAASQTMARITPFQRPTILGLDQMVRGAKANPGAWAFKAFISITLPALLLYFLNDEADKDLPDGEKYSDIPRFQRDGFLISPPVAGVRPRMPIPPDIGVAFHALPIRFLDWLKKEDPDAFKSFGQRVMQAVTPPILPAAVTPVAEHATGYNTFTGRPLIPSSLEGASGPMQYQEYTTHTARTLSNLLGNGLRVQQPVAQTGAERAYQGVGTAMGMMPPTGAETTVGGGVEISPIVLENYVRGWTGPLGMLALKALDIPFKPTTTPWEITDIPFVQSFFVRNPGMSAQPIQDFFDLRKDMEKQHRDRVIAKRNLLQGMGDEAQIQRETEQELPMKLMNNTADAINAQHAILRGIANNKGMSTDEKRQLIDTTTALMVSTAKAGLTVGRDIVKAFKERPGGQQR
jgi:hypothetical protein